MGWSDEPDLDNRDPNNLNDHLKVSFEEVIGEPDHTHSIDCCFRFSYKCFNLWKSLCYIIATIVWSVYISSLWGCYFAIIAFYHIWVWTPFIRAYEVNVKLIGKFYTICVSACCDPCFETCGKVFSAFKK